MNHAFGIAETIFLIMLVAILGVSFLARRHAIYYKDDGLAGRSLNRWIIGLSAGATANSGFIVTAAVGLGYTYGVQWIMLPISWLLGDLLFWRIFPARINAFGHDNKVTTLSEMLKSGLTGRMASVVAILSAIVIIVCLAGYTSAQWLAGQKFLSGAFDMPPYFALGLFAMMIIAYSSIGGFRGSVYTDTLLALIRIVGTIVALGAVTYFAFSDQVFFSQNIKNSGEDFLTLFPNGTLATSIGFVAGFAAAGLGFGLGQPQVISRYLAGKNPQETAAAKWIYIGFVQFTWIAMTAFGILLRGVMPDISDPETGLSVFFQNHINAIATGIIVADIFATIAATSNSILIAMAQVAIHDLIPRVSSKISQKTPFSAVTFFIGIITMVISVSINSTVLDLALASVSLLGAGLAAAVIIKVMKWGHTAISLACTIGIGFTSALTWRYMGMSTYLNEAGIGILSGLVVNWLIIKNRKMTLS